MLHNQVMRSGEFRYVGEVLTGEKKTRWQVMSALATNRSHRHEQRHLSARAWLYIQRHLTMRKFSETIFQARLGFLHSKYPPALI